MQEAYSMKAKKQGNHLRNSKHWRDCPVNRLRIVNQNKNKNSIAFYFLDIKYSQDLMVGNIKNFDRKNQNTATTGRLSKHNPMI